MAEDTPERARPLRFHVPLPDGTWLCRYTARGRRVSDDEAVITPVCGACLAALDLQLFYLMDLECADPDISYLQALELLRSDPCWEGFAAEYGPPMLPEQGPEYPFWEFLKHEAAEHTERLVAEGSMPADPCALYRHFDADGVLLYVGITSDADARRDQHAKASAWAEFAVRDTCEWFESRETAAVAERKAIESEQPLFNRACAGPDRDQRVIEYVVKRQAWHLLKPV